MDTTVGLRERKKLDTRRALSDAALELAFERGLENVTRDDIAARAGVSLRTFNNYFTGKYEAVAYRQIQRMRRSLAVFRERPADEPLWSAITDAMLAPLEAEGAADVLPTPEELVVVRDLLSARDMRAALTKDLFADWVDAIADRTRNRPGSRYVPTTGGGGRPGGRRNGHGGVRGGRSARAYHRLASSRSHRCRGRTARTEEELMTETEVDVVISGAGPNGLMLACELALAGVRPVVLEKLPAPSDEPKANGLVGQVIRLLDMRGLYGTFTGSDDPPKPMYEWIFSGMPVRFGGVARQPDVRTDDPAAAARPAARRAGA